MHVPYSMDDREPDLYGSLGGGCDEEWETQTKWESEDRSSGYADPYPHSTIYHPVIEQTKLYNQEDMTKVIQHNLRDISELRSEIEELKGLLSYIYNHAERLPVGCSQQIREALTK
ncbi:hypothetical protein D3C75_591750 [compost metagenome]